MGKFLMVLIWAVIIAVIALGIYALIAYGGKPITEIPSWAVWFFIKG